LLLEDGFDSGIASDTAYTYDSGEWRSETDENQVKSGEIPSDAGSVQVDPLALNSSRWLRKWQQVM
jgi:hypothetical protein